MNPITTIYRALDDLERQPDLPTYDLALRDLGLRIAGLRTTLMERHSYGEACARVDAMFPSMKEAAE